MEQLLKKIYTILILAKNLIMRKKYYTLHFVAEIDPPIKRWFYDFKHWGFNHNNLEMVCGADTLCELYSNEQNELTINIICQNKPIKNFSASEFDEYEAKPFPKEWNFLDRHIWGCNYKQNTYNENENGRQMWICPVTLFVLGRYPKYIYIRK